MDINYDMPGYAFLPAEGLPAFLAASIPRGATPLDQLPLASSYVPMQQFSETYDSLRALERGTIFPCLDLPFCGRVVK